MAHNPTFISLFSGCGGLDTGLIHEGFTCLRAFDIDSSVIEVHRRNLGDSGTVADLTSTSNTVLRSAGHPDVVVAGSPCQGFSTAGKRDINDPRNSLLLRAGHAAIALRPRVFVAENVPGAVAGAHGMYWNELDSMMRGAGYSTVTLKLNATDVGLAQRRTRVILLAWRGSREPSFTSRQISSRTLRHVLKAVDGLPQHEREFLPSGSKALLIAKRIKQGQKLCNVRGGDASVHTWDIPEAFGQTTAKERAVLEMTMLLRRRNRQRDYGDADPVSAKSLRQALGYNAGDIVKSLIRKSFMRKIDGGYDLANTFNGKYRRLAWHSASLTVDTRFGDPRYFLHPTEHRGFTVREAARIQGFPDWFEFTANPTDSFRMIGNAVPPPLGSFLAGGIKTLLP